MSKKKTGLLSAIALVFWEIFLTSTQLGEEVLDRRFLLKQNDTQETRNMNDHAEESEVQDSMNELKEEI